MDSLNLQSNSQISVQFLQTNNDLSVTSFALLSILKSKIAFQNIKIQR